MMVHESYDDFSRRSLWWSPDRWTALLLYQLASKSTWISECGLDKDEDVVLCDWIIEEYTGADEDGDEAIFF